VPHGTGAVLGREDSEQSCDESSGQKMGIAFKASKALRLQIRHSAPLDLANQPPSPVLTRGRTRPGWSLEEEEVTTREAILKSLEAAD
jgi:hypothetical protein